MCVPREQGVGWDLLRAPRGVPRGSHRECASLVFLTKGSLLSGGASWQFRT